MKYYEEKWSVSTAYFWAKSMRDVQNGHILEPLLKCKGNLRFYSYKENSYVKKYIIYKTHAYL